MQEHALLLSVTGFEVHVYYKLTFCNYKKVLIDHKYT